MNKIIRGLIVLAISHKLLAICCSYAASDSLNDTPPLPKDTKLFEAEKTFGYRGKIGAFLYPPCVVGAYPDQKVFYKDEPVVGMDKLEYTPDHQSMKVMYKKSAKEAFCGAYIILMSDLSGYKTITFLIKGTKGGETFEIGMNDVISNKREDAVYVGAINRYLPDGITTSWQLVKIPISDFYGPDLSKTYSLIFYFNQMGSGEFWIDELRFSKEDLVSRERAAEIKKKGYLLLDDFDYSDLNLLGRKTNAYKRLPSVCTFERVSEEHFGPAGRSLKINYKKESTGWCGYYTLLNQIDGEYYDLSGYKSASFMVKGKKGTETFELGMADKNWGIIGDSLKAGTISKYLPGGVTKQWQEVIIPLEDFGLLDFSQMGSFVINFNEPGEGAVYIDDLKFI